ncbi:MAG: type II secretion system protein [Firmicutes bacterium]|nr:type II secretion system protein [Bacillota bacterium]
MLKNLRNRLSDNKGFSLVELIVVIAIMVILIAILVPNITGYINKSRDVSAAATAKTVYDAAYAYQTELLGKNDVTYKDESTIFGALTTDGSAYKLDVTGSLVQGASTGDTVTGLTVDPSDGKITTSYWSLVENKAINYPDGSDS